MTLTTAPAYTALGRRTAESLGLVPDDLDLDAYGAAVSRAIARQSALPDPRRFRLVPVALATRATLVVPALATEVTDVADRAAVPPPLRHSLRDAVSWWRWQVSEFVAGYREESLR